jgi:hypothetical protein
MIYRYFEASTTCDRFTPDISPTGIEDEGDGGDRGVEGDEGEKTSLPSLPSPPLICQLVCQLVRNSGLPRRWWGS